MSDSTRHVCPVCGFPIPLKLLRKRVGGFFSALSPKLGIECTNCRSALKLNGRRTALAIGAAAVFFFAFGLAMNNPLQNHLSILQMAGLIPLLLAYIYGSSLVSVRPSRPDERLSFSRDPWENFDREFPPRDQEAEADDLLEDERIAEINSPVRQPWTCSGCSAENPATFDICWQCERFHDDI
jgi:hypothetical protein